MRNKFAAKNIIIISQPCVGMCFLLMRCSGQGTVKLRNVF